jgi:hypothetical protein
MAKQGHYTIFKKLTVGKPNFIFNASGSGSAKRYETLCSISAVPTFPGLRRFPDGRDFIQWTGDDSKALMKVTDLSIARNYPNESFIPGLSCCDQGPGS